MSGYRIRTQDQYTVRYFMHVNATSVCWALTYIVSTKVVGHKISLDNAETQIIEGSGQMIEVLL